MRCFIDSLCEDCLIDCLNRFGLLDSFSFARLGRRVVIAADNALTAADRGSIVICVEMSAVELGWCWLSVQKVIVVNEFKENSCVMM